MKTILGFIGSAIYGIILSYLLWLIFYFLTPWLMGFGWTALILYSLFAGGLITSIVGGLSTLISLPLFLMSKNKVSKIIPALALAFHGYSAVAMPWHIGTGGRFVTFIIALSISFTAFSIFALIIYSLFADREDQ